MTRPFKMLPGPAAVAMGFSPDKRRRRRQHRRAARRLVEGGTLLNARAPRTSTPGMIAHWHLFQARYWGR